MVENQKISAIAATKSTAFIHKMGASVIDKRKLKIIIIMAFFFIGALMLFFSCHSTIEGPNLG